MVYLWPENPLTISGVILAVGKEPLINDSSPEFHHPVLIVRLMVVTIVTARIASMLILSGITGIIRGLTKDEHSQKSIVPGREVTRWMRLSN